MATPKVPQGGIAKEFGQAVVSRVAGITSAASKYLGGKPNVASQEEQSRAFDPPNGYFPAGKPLAPVAPPGSTTGRASDLPSFINLTYAPRQEQGENTIDFPTLRRMADPAQGGLDILRLAIETRKDQMANQRWSIRGKEKNDDGGPKARAFEKWLAKPDGVHTFRQWMRLLLEDHFVIDAPTIFFSGARKRPLLEVVDGATIKLIVTGDDFRTPLPPLPAYAQVIKGTPAEYYTLDEIGYYAYNLRPNKLYGMSRVEQVLATVSMALNRQLSQISFFTAGTVPDGLIEMPKEYTMTQIAQWAEWFNSELAGNLDKRRQLQMVPQGANYKATKEAVLKDTFDEWMARIVCYCFSLSPQAFVKEMNRATSSTAKQAAQEEGLEPTKLWFKDAMDDVLTRVGDGSLEWGWVDEEIVDPEAKSRVIISYYGGSTGTAAKILTLAEAREMAGFPPATPEQLTELQPPAPVIDQNAPSPANGNGNGNGKPKPGEKGAPVNRLAGYSKAGRGAGGRSLPRGKRTALAPLQRNQTLAEHTERGLRAHALTVVRAQLAHARHLLTGAATKASASGESLREFLDQVDSGALEWNEVARDALRELIANLAADRAAAAVTQVSGYLAEDADLDALLHQANMRAVAWAEARVGNLVTDVSDTTRDAINELTASAIENGLSKDQLAEQLGEAWAFSEERAGLIATTETAFAESAGSLEGYRASGVVEGKGWSGEDPCDECQGNEDAGEIPLDDDFPSEDDAPPAHPSCKCTVYPVVFAPEEVAAE